MAVTPLGNIIYVNQNMQTNAIAQANQQARFDLQALTQMEAFNAQEKKVEEVRPTEQSYNVDPDREHERQTREEEQEERDNPPKHADAQGEAPSAPSTHHLLDITV